MTDAQKTQIIGTEGTFNMSNGSGSMTVRIRITDVRPMFGRIDYRITPVNGQGEIWTQADKVALDLQVNLTKSLEQKPEQA